MKVTSSALAALLLADHALAFTSPQPFRVHGRSSSSQRYMAAVDAPALPVIQANPYGQPTEVRYSDFLKLVDADRLEKVTFSSDGTQLLGVDVDGARIKIEALPNDPDLLNQLTSHKVRIQTKKKRHMRHGVCSNTPAFLSFF